MKLLRSDIYENLRMALTTIRSQRLRSSLAITGVAIGIGTIVLIASIINGIDVAVRKEVETIGTHSIFITKFDSGIHSGSPSREERMRKLLTYEDALAITKLPAVEFAVPFIDITNDFNGQKIPVAFNGKTSYAVQLLGTLPDYGRVNRDSFAEGRYFTQFESDTNQQVCLIGASVAANFFPVSSPIGQKLKIGGREFRVLGYFVKRDQFVGGLRNNHDQSNFIYMPFSVARKLKPNAEDLSIHVLARPGRLSEAKDQIVDLLRTRRRVQFGQPNDFGMSTADAIIEQFRSISFGISITMILVSSISLLTGGISVMNIMLVSVTERTHEIGIRKAVGACRRDILWQFLIEAITLTAMGGIIGMVVGWVSAIVITIFAPSDIPLWAAMLGITMSVGTGLIFGVWPAWKASQLDPIDCLRYE